MSTAGQPLPPPKEPRRNSGTLLAAIVIAVLLMLLGCAGACAGVLYLAVPRARVALEAADVEIPGITVQSPVNDWMMTRTLSQIYTTSLAAVVSNKDVIERLGEPVMADLEAEDLYRRKNTGALGSGEEISFDITGPRGKGVVTVTAYGAENIAKITVAFEDGSSIDLPLPEPLPFIVR